MTEPVSLEDYVATADQGWHDMLARPTDKGEMRLLPAFSGDGLLDTHMANFKHDEERGETGHAPMGRDAGGIQLAQGWNGIPSIPVPRPQPSTRGYDIGAKDAMEGLDSTQESLNQSSEFRARSRQMEIGGQFETEQQRSASSRSPDSYFALQPRQPYVTDQNSIAPVGRGNTYMSSGPFGQKYYVDRNGDGTPDVILQYRDGKTYADFGDEEGLSVYSRQRYRPAPPPPSGRR